MHEDGGIEHAQRLVHQLFLIDARFRRREPERRKTRLQELLQGNGLDLPVYTVEEVSGADHQRQYTVKCEAESLNLMAVAKESSRRAAEKASAHEVLILAWLSSKPVGRQSTKHALAANIQCKPKGLAKTMSEQGSTQQRCGYVALVGRLTWASPLC